ncbi:MAG: DUF4430 domain-containing protein [Candidatus Methanosuratus sp.]|nr:DUF4430 domain-containing protein [Candidatus Methanosuratincola sp.]
MARNTWTIISGVLLIWAIGATVGLAYYYQTSQNQQVLIENYESVIDDVVIKVNLGIDYGNGTTVWNNDTYVPIGSDLLNATLKVAQVNYTEYSSGILVNGINGVLENKSASTYWLYYVWSDVDLDWVEGYVGADQYILKNGESVKWVLKVYTP